MSDQTIRLKPVELVARLRADAEKRALMEDTHACGMFVAAAKVIETLWEQIQAARKPDEAAPEEPPAP